MRSGGLAPEDDEMPAALKPKLFADAIADAVSAAVASRTILCIGAEAARIAGATGISPWVVAGNLIEAGRRAQIAMELPTARQLEILVEAPRRGVATSLSDSCRPARPAWRHSEC
jgi:hypothetical protein